MVSFSSLFGRFCADAIFAVSRFSKEWENNCGKRGKYYASMKPVFSFVLMCYLKYLKYLFRLIVKKLSYQTNSFDICVRDNMHIALNRKNSQNYFFPRWSLVWCRICPYLVMQFLEHCGSFFAENFEKGIPNKARSLAWARTWESGC